LLRTYFPRNWEFGSALSRLRNFGGGLNTPNPPPPLGTPVGTGLALILILNLRVLNYAAVFRSLGVRNHYIAFVGYLTEFRYKPFRKPASTNRGPYIVTKFQSLEEMHFVFSITTWLRPGSARNISNRLQNIRKNYR